MGDPSAGASRSDRGALMLAPGSSRRDAAGRLPGAHRLHGAHESDEHRVRARRPSVRRREERPHQGLRLGRRTRLRPSSPTSGPTSTTSGIAGCSVSRSIRSSRPSRTSTSSTRTTHRWAVAAPVFNDACGDPTGNGCVVSARLSRLQASGNVMTGSEQMLIHDWCQQFPSHSIGDLAFGADGALYVSSGDGASFNYVDQGQTGNPCG